MGEHNKHHLTVLLVDDDIDFRNIVAGKMPKFGYQLLIAEDGGTSVEMLRESISQIDLILMDQMMPVIDGLQTFRNMKPEFEMDLYVWTLSSY